VLGDAGALVNQKDTIDNWTNVDEEFRNEWVGGTTLAPWGLAWNNDMVEKDELTSWDDLIDPSLEGKTGLWAWNSAGHKIFYAINAIQGGSLDDIQPGVEWLEEFVEVTDPMIFDTGANAQKMLAQGEVAAAPFLQAWATRVTLDSDGDTPVQWAVPEEGAWTDFWGYPLLKHRPDANIEAAKAFLEGCYTKEAQAKFADLTGYPPAMSNSTDLISDETKENYPNIVLSDEQIEGLSKLDIDWVRVQSIKAEHQQEWRRVISG
jgi:spermidine/putrescine-binding protein